MKLYNGAGHSLRVWLASNRASMSALAAASGIAKWKISAYTLGGFLTDEELSKVEAALDAIEKISSAIHPARLDCRDGAALKTAVDAFHQGRFADVHRVAVQPERRPAVATF